MTDRWGSNIILLSVWKRFEWNFQEMLIKCSRCLCMQRLCFYLLVPTPCSDILSSGPRRTLGRNDVIVWYFFTASAIIYYVLAILFPVHTPGSSNAKGKWVLWHMCTLWQVKTGKWINVVSFGTYWPVLAVFLQRKTRGTLQDGGLPVNKMLNHQVPSKAESINTQP